VFSESFDSHSETQASLSMETSVPKLLFGNFRLNMNVLSNFAIFVIKNL
jgi:hypothetical protein